MAVTQSTHRRVEELAPAMPSYVDSYSFAAAGAAQAIAVPPGAVLAIFSPVPRDGDFFVRADGGTAAAPGASVTNGTASFPNPSVLSVTPGSTFSMIGNSAAEIDIAIAYYATRY